MTKSKFILRCAGYAIGKIAGLMLALWLVQGCKTTKPVRHSPIQNDRYYAFNQTNMPVYVINFQTWRVEETTTDDPRLPKFDTMYDACTTATNLLLAQQRQINAYMIGLDKQMKESDCEKEGDMVEWFT